MRWAAYISGGNAWSTSSGYWLGPSDGLTCLDQSGAVVAWNPGQAPQDGGSALTPPTPFPAHAADATYASDTPYSTDTFDPDRRLVFAFLRGLAESVAAVARHTSGEPAGLVPAANALDQSSVA